MTPLHHLWKLFLILPGILSSGSKTPDERLISEWGSQSVLTASTSVSLSRLCALVDAQVYVDVALQDYTKYSVLVCFFGWAIIEGVFLGDGRLVRTHRCRLRSKILYHHMSPLGQRRIIR